MISASCIYGTLKGAIRECLHHSYHRLFYTFKVLKFYMILNHYLFYFIRSRKIWQSWEIELVYFRACEPNFQFLTVFSKISVFESNNRCINAMSSIHTSACTARLRQL
ncbi:hypothetical protein MS3_00001705 [Schistosoma haematobium]|uniref:Uncharacterized protein n=1 Tax=Schistosoma haematobium TaxID=6185 RepID=A0A922LY75_SCHHA|nr:hypothetical protein MS3_00001705 [Schistosoma haematobium]KAH9595777.1 hypothetical protein MS3_00001705 [Schistosoma haematobium]